VWLIFKKNYNLLKTQITPYKNKKNTCFFIWIPPKKSTTPLSQTLSKHALQLFDKKNQFQAKTHIDYACIIFIFYH
jgi:hypothetical protein